MGSVWVVAHNIFFSPYVIKHFFYVIFQALGVYFNLYFLIPRFLIKGRYVVYGCLLLLTIFGIATFITSGYYVSAFWSDHSFQELYGIDPRKYAHFFQLNTLPSTVASMTLAMSIKLTKNWIQSTRRQQLLEREKLETELQFLKSQLNPHFLFNTINSIFVLIHKNPKMASEALAKFSDLLRYQLYESNEQQIPLRQELDNLENFIALEKLRHEKDNLELLMQMEPTLFHNLTIAPFILMPFIENAFKHVSRHTDGLNWIRINLCCNQRQVEFSIVNSISSFSNSSFTITQSSGIGLKNVQRRLDLLYPDTHTLTFQQDEHQFGVLLRIALQEGSAARVKAIAMN